MNDFKYIEPDAKVSLKAIFCEIAYQLKRIADNLWR